ncbi:MULTISPECIES: galactan 5-O-arabinofuranosyltransferase [Gordonia]|uniref:galactan 5-O-arabinofuranosyltransferase n=1 Tax=Gordonia TaxID=2053 RepID=UPI0002BF6548|nr:MULTISPECIES: galactan 5-O-arabinofuranosyltransferase [Gordonia]EMP13349.1 arabinofuranosyltransferase [Gordonia sp. NB41Y]WLP92727.1 galactan 5-O-arabinofuranosyltransferase [Gordonia sp. NB41Y]
MNSTVTRRGLDPRLTTLLELVAAVVVAAIIGLVGVKVIDTVQWPAFNSSNVTRALTTVGQVIAIAFLLVGAIAYRYGRSRWITTLCSTIGVAGLVTVTLGMPLGATRLYLFGLSVDQQFRTEYLTRLTSSPRLADMTYIDLAPYYPAGWFWWGGRYAEATGMPAWEAYKPWAILTIAIAAAIAVVLWNRMVGGDRGAAIALAVTVTTLMYASPEPYAAVLVLIGIPMLIPMLYALRGRSRLADGPTASLAAGTSWVSVVAVGLMLGLCATFYTLYAGLFAGIAVLMALVLIVDAWRRAGNKAVPGDTVMQTRRGAVLAVLVRLVVMAVVAMVVAALVWAPYVLDRLRNAPASGGTAEHYLPERGALLPLPMFQTNLIGLITLIGLIWILLRFRTRTIALAFGIAVVGIYLFCLLSMIRTATGSTLLSFRLDPILVGILAAAGVFGVAELSRWAVGRFGDIRFVIGAVATAAAITLAQGIPGYLSHEITTAYTDTDGYGERADQRPAGAESFYPQLRHLIEQQTGRPDTENIVLTADYGFLSIYPFWGFQGLTSHYANPLAEFDKRAATISAWSEATSADDLIGRIDRSPWPAPNVFLFRYAADGYTLRLAEDVYPNDPNVKRYTVTFDRTLFDDPRFEVTEVGPFVLVVRK